MISTTILYHTVVYLEIEDKRTGVQDFVSSVVLQTQSMFNRKKKITQALRLDPLWQIIVGDFHHDPSYQQVGQFEGFSLVKTVPKLSKNQRFAVVGDIWLSNRHLLLTKLGMNPNTWKEDDSTLIAWLWEQWGQDCLHELRGIFSFIVWDTYEKKGYAVRDSVGGRTLYYYQQGSTLYLAPRLRNLSPYFQKNIDLIALKDYLCTAFVPGERTLWQGVKELRPGTILSLPDGTIEPYWQPQETISKSPLSFEESSEALRALLETIMLEYLPSQEPVGVYLSGGLDSSCVTALAKQFHDDTIHTYSIHFGQDYPNELEFSSLVASHCQTHHHILEISPQQMWDNLTITMANLDNPIGDPLTVPNYLLAQLAKEDVKVILNGEGSDPCFGGPKNQPMLLYSLYHTPEQNVDLLSSYLTSFKKCFLDLPQLLKPDIFQKVNNQASVFEPDLLSSADYVNRLMLLNIKFKGSDHILNKVNNLTRSGCLAGRAPLFDRRIVDFSLSIPPHYKLAGAREKAILKQAVSHLLPATIIDRPKSGMMVPVNAWFRQYWQRKAKRLLLNKRAAIAPYLQQDIIKAWLNYQGDIWGKYGIKLWLLVSLEIWLKTYEE